MIQLPVPVLLLFAAGLLAAADNPSVAGQWKVHSNIVGNESDQDCTFTQRGNDLSGSCKGEQGSVTIAGKVDNQKVTWQFKSEYNGEPLTIVYSGNVDSAAKIAGTVDVQPMGVSGDFTATKSK